MADLPKQCKACWPPTELTGGARPGIGRPRPDAQGAGPSLRNLAKNGKAPCASFFPGVIAMAVIVVASNILVQYPLGRLPDLGGADLSLRLSGHRPDQPPAGPRRRPPRGAGGLCDRDRLFLHRHADHGRVRPAGHLAHRPWLGHRVPVRRSFWTSPSSTACGSGSWWRAPLVSTLVSSTSIPRSSSPSPFRPR